MVPAKSSMSLIVDMKVTFDLSHGVCSCLFVSLPQASIRDLFSFDFAIEFCIPNKESLLLNEN